DNWNSISKNPDHPLTNRALSSVYPPGSTFKLFYAAAGLARKIINPDTTFHCPGFYTFAGHRFRCHKRGGHGSVNLVRAISESCNAYFYQLGHALGIGGMHEFG